MTKPPRTAWAQTLLAKWPALCATATLIALFFVPSWGRSSGRISSYSTDLAHYPLFATVAAILLYLWPRHRTAVAKAGVVSGIAVSLALLIEVFQPLAGRSAALGDVLLGTAGSFSVVAVYLGLRIASPHGRRWLVAMAGLLLLLSVSPLLMVVLDRWVAHRSFPLIDSFERPAEVSRWVADGCALTQVEDHATQGRFAMRMEILPSDEKYPGAVIADGTMDWRGFRQLTLDVHLEGEGSRSLWIRADDRLNPPYHDRAQVAVELKAGSNRVAIDVPSFARTPEGRALDLERIVSLGIFLDGARPGDVLYLDYLRLSGRVGRPAVPVAAPRPERGVSS
jgi:hypothetical protein